MIPPNFAQYYKQASEAKDLIDRLEDDGQLLPPSDPSLLVSGEDAKRELTNFESLIRDVERIRDKAKRRWCGELRARRKMQNKLQLVAISSGDLSKALNTLNTTSHQFMMTFRIIRSLIEGVLPDPHDGSKSSKFKKARQDLDLNLGRYRITGDLIIRASGKLLKFKNYITEDMFGKVPSLNDTFEDAKNLIEITAKDMYSFPFDAFYHRETMRIVESELDVLISQVRSLAIEISAQAVEQTVLNCRARLAAGPKLYEKLRSKGGSECQGQSQTPEISPSESQKPDALDKGICRDLYIGVAPKYPFAGNNPSCDSEFLVVQGPAEIRRISDLSHVNVIEDGTFINFSKRHTRIPILKGLKEYDEKIREEGGYGDVYRIENPPGIEKAVAVKVMRHPDLARRYRAVYREIYAWSLLVEKKGSPWEEDPSHNFLPLYGICLGLVFNDPCPALVSPWCKDGNLFQYAKGSLPSKKFNLLAQAAQGIKFLHSHSPPIIHGDVKATNILIWEGKAVLADFGIAKCLDGVKGLSPTGRMWYTVSYRAPELRLGYEEYPTTESDVYAFGATVLETLTESPPFKSYTEAQINSFLEMDKTPADVEFRPKVGPAMEDCHWDFMQECLNFHQCDRPSISDILSRLKEFQDRSSSHIPS